MSRKIFNYILILVATCVPVPAKHIRPAVRLTTNANVTDAPGRYPYIICLLDKGTIRECTGTLLSAEWVLTAAHCIIYNDITHIQYGNMSIPPKNTASRSKVIESIPHPKYSYGKILTYDIGLLRVNAVPLNTFGILSWVDYNTLFGQQVEYAGFGIRITQKMLKNNFRIETLVLVQTRPLHLSEGLVTPCEDIKQQQGTKSFVCVNPICTRNITQLQLSQCLNIHHFAEDSGGPLFLNKKIIGVTSWGGADRAMPAGVYTPIGLYKSWIEKYIQPSTPKPTSIAKKMQMSIQDIWKRIKGIF